jgi:hypothetical protein
MALAISYAEDGNRICDRTHINNNLTLDVGLFMINSIHKYTISDLIDCHKNIQIAHTIFTEQGNWSAWSTFNNGSYKKFLK